MTPSKWINEYRLSKDIVEKLTNYDEIENFEADEYFVLIKIKKEEKIIELAVVDSNLKTDKQGKEYYEITHILKGKKPQDIYFPLSKINILKLNDHYAYVGKELQKAYDALMNDKKYVQV